MTGGRGVIPLREKVGVSIVQHEDMRRFGILFSLILTVFFSVVSGQVKIRLFSDQSPGSVLFSVTRGNYEINFNNGIKIPATRGDIVIISKFHGNLAVKLRNKSGFICDSVAITGKSDDNSFYLRINGKIPLRQYYSGDLRCFPDLETLVLINVCDYEKYISGVVEAESGNGKYIEYYKSQAVIARTYMYRYFEKHVHDRYNLCDNTHCQAFNGVSEDTLITRATLETKGQVILDHSRELIMAAFHSNCGGETSSAEDVWLTRQPYLKNVVDPYCLTSRNAVWRKSISMREWIECLKSAGYEGKVDDPSVFSFQQNLRSSDYKAGTFTLPVRIIRDKLNLRSTFFSVVSQGDSVILRGKGYGHGVGFCQEGAMVMASKGFSYNKIIEFYYSGVLISDVKNAVNLPAISSGATKVAVY